MKLNFNKENKPLTKKPMDAAADILTRRPYSSHDLAQKMIEKGYPKEDVSETIAKLIDMGYLNDEEYARMFAEQAVLNGKGNGYIKNKLNLSGIPRELIPSPENEFERAMKIAEKMDGKTPEQIGRRLASRGFAPATVYKIMEKFR